MKWTPARKGSTPEKKQKVIALLENGEMHVLQFDGEWEYNHLYPIDPDFAAYHKFSPVIYWMPLPEVPKDKK